MSEIVKVETSDLSSAASAIETLKGDYDDGISKINGYIGNLSCLWTSGSEREAIISDFPTDINNLKKVSDNFDLIKTGLNEIQTKYETTDSTAQF